MINLIMRHNKMNSTNSANSINSMNLKTFTLILALIFTTTTMAGAVPDFCLRPLSASDRALDGIRRIVKTEAQGNSEDFLANMGLVSQLTRDLGVDDPLFRKGANNLGDLVAALHRQQKKTDVIRKDLIQAVQRGEWKLKRLDVYPWRLLNTARAIGKDIEYEDPKACQTKDGKLCRLDANKLRKAERELLYHWRDYFIHMNIFPGFEGHLMITYREHRPQFVDETIMRDMMELVFKLPDYRIFYNHVSRNADGSIYANCGSSIPDHNHCQAIIQRLPVEDAKTELIARIGNVDVKKVIGLPVRAFSVEGRDVTKVAEKAWMVVKELNSKIEDAKKGRTTGVVGYNILWTKDKDVAKIIIFPRAAGNRPSIAVQDGQERAVYNGVKNKLLKILKENNSSATLDTLASLSKEEVDELLAKLIGRGELSKEELLAFDKYDIGIASIEMSGIIINNNRRDFERFSPKEASKALAKCSTPETALISITQPYTLGVEEKLLREQEGHMPNILLHSGV